jgi:signal transduction histidine kinase
MVEFLLVDDREENLLALEGLLRREGLGLLKANSGEEALEFLLGHEVALAIVDVQMPGMDGFELAELMRHSLRTKNIPIIFLTAGGLDDQRRFRGYEMGAVDFLYKPIEPSVLQGKAEVFYDLYLQRQVVTKQRDELRIIADENARLYNDILQLNDTLEERVTQRTIQLLEANEHLEGFTHSIAHDFRQHIRNINVNASIVLEEMGDALGEHRPNLERITQVARLMSQMTEDLLTYARIRNATLRPVEIDVTELVEEIAESCKIDFPRSQFKVEEGLSVCADRTMSRILLENLVDNAFKYSQHAEQPFVEVGEDANGFFVRDNGIGFNMAFAHKLFLPFERLISESEIGGTGMGLANVKRILEKHGGSISVESEPQKGTTFHFSIRADQPTNVEGS